MKTALPKITEAQFLRQVEQLAKLRGWRTFHTRPAMTAKGRWLTAVSGSGVGFPDLLLVRGEVLLFVELKVGKNKPTADQLEWLDALQGAGVRAEVWRPEMWQDIEKRLM